jgi:putative ABC transport system permease protein
MNTLWQDLRYGARMLRKKPGFTFIAVMTLAVGIGATTTVFSVVDAWLLRPLPFKEPNRLVAIWESEVKNPGVPAIFASYRHYQEWERQSQSFENMAAFYWQSYALTGAGEAESLMGQIVTANYFSTLGINAVRGRTFLPDDLNGPPVAVLGYGFWQRRFAGAADVEGQTLTLDDRTYTIIGVAPPGLSLPSIAQPNRAEDVWVLLRPNEPMRGDQSFEQAPDQPIGVVARLRPDVTAEQAQAELDAIKRKVDETAQPLWKNYNAFAAGLQQDATRSLRPTLLLLSAATGFVLLIACANIAGLMLARLAERRKELAVRAALGAGRWRMTRQLLTESLLLALMASAAGLLLALWGLPSFLALHPFEIPPFNDMTINLRVLGFTALLSLFTAALFGVIPALQAARLDVNELLKENTRSSSHSLRQSRARCLLVVAEVALSLLLLAGAGLMIRSFARLATEPRGFNMDKLMTAAMTLPRKTYSQPEQQASFCDRLLERVRPLPGVQAVSATTVLPLYTGGTDELAIEGRAPSADGEGPTTSTSLISANYFATVGIPLTRGRLFDDHDREKSEAVAIINETLARQAFPGTEPLGQRVRLGGAASQAVWRTIVGVVGDTRVSMYGSLGRQTRPMMYLPYRQGEAAGGPLYLVVHYSGDSAQFAATLRDEMKAMNPDLVPPYIETVQELASREMRQPRLQTMLSVSFAVMALLLAAVGLYSIISYSIIQRTHEIGIRMALGARARDVLTLVLGQGVRLTLAGVAIGLLASVAFTRFIQSLLYEVSANDPVTLALIALLLIAVALAACYLPARRATRVDPLVALRHE